MTNLYAIGVDLGGTKIEVALVNSKGQASNNVKIPTAVHKGPEVIADDIVSIVNTLKNIARDQIVGIGIGVPGQVSAQDGIVRFAPNLKWENVPFQQELMRKTNLPVAITNDVRAATWGEWLHGSGKGSKDIVCLFVGTGIGSGIVSGGQMLQGFNNSAGEWGHTIIQMDGPLCTCGSKGCFEALASGWAIARKAQQLIKENHEAGKNLLEKAEGKIENVTTKMVVDAYHEKDLLAEEIVVGMFHALTVGCINIANALNPERLILGGGVLSGLAEAIDHVSEGVKKYALKSASQDLQIMRTKLTQNAGVIGAGTLAWKTLYKGKKCS
jgi:glucokinase